MKFTKPTQEDVLVALVEIDVDKMMGCIQELRDEFYHMRYVDFDIIGEPWTDHDAILAKYFNISRIFEIDYERLSFTLESPIYTFQTNESGLGECYYFWTNNTLISVDKEIVWQLSKEEGAFFYMTTEEKADILAARKYKYVEVVELNTKTIVQRIDVTKMHERSVYRIRGNISMGVALDGRLYDRIAEYDSEQLIINK